MRLSCLTHFCKNFISDWVSSLWKGVLATSSHFKIIFSWEYFLHWQGWQYILCHYSSILFLKQSKKTKNINDFWICFQRNVGCSVVMAPLIIFVSMPDLIRNSSKCFTDVEWRSILNIDVGGKGKFLQSHYC